MLDFYTKKSTLPAQYADSVDLKDGLMNYMVCTVKFPVVQSYFVCNTTPTEQKLNYDKCTKIAQKGNTFASL